jgi:putative hydrolase of the HAD superfamily
MGAAPHSPIRAVLFDAVGTLLLPREPVAETYRRLAEPLGSRLPAKEIAERFAAALQDDALREETTEELERLRWRKTVAVSLPDLAPNVADMLFEQLWDYYATPQAWMLYEDVADAWQRLAALGLTLGIASNFDSRFDQVRGGHPPLDQVQWCFVSSQVGYRKPSPKFFAAIASCLQLRPHEIMLVGDDPRSDYQAALAAGWQAVLVEPSRRTLVEAVLPHVGPTSEQGCGLMDGTHRTNRT